MGTCDNCNKPYEYALRICLMGGHKTCFHDNPLTTKKFKGAIVKGVDKTLKMIRREEQKIKAGVYN